MNNYITDNPMKGMKSYIENKFGNVINNNDHYYKYSYRTLFGDIIGLDD